MSATESIDKIAQFFDAPVKNEQMFIEYGSETYPAWHRTINCNYAQKNQYIIPFPNLMFGYMVFDNLLFTRLPPGYHEEEFTIFAPLPLIGNDSYDQTFVDKAYDRIEPALKRKFPQYPVFFQNLWGKVYLCIMLNPKCEISGSMIRSAIDIINTVRKYVENTYY